MTLLIIWTAVFLVLFLVFGAVMIVHTRRTRPEACLICVLPLPPLRWYQNWPVDPPPFCQDRGACLVRAFAAHSIEHP